MSHLSEPTRDPLLASVELDLGTMSHARLRQRAELYAGNGRVVAVKPRPAFTAYFQAVAQTSKS